ncbi:MAG: hypothetical protein M1826_002607 [Phylliscum demangeonii]|nr:MAG: hypothetical protein M1826_002607 [Phylliscum demangeonii]
MASSDLDTPRTVTGNATFTSNAGLDFSLEPSFMSPSKERRMAAQRVDSKANASPNKTPTGRHPLAERRNGPAGPSTTQAEFTPLLRSVVKTNMLNQHAKRAGVPDTPAFLRPGYRDNNPPPALPEISPAMYGDAGSSWMEASILPQVVSTTDSSPLGVLPMGEDTAVLADGKNTMALREQDNTFLIRLGQIVNKIEKENFGLKLKIHFLEDALRRAGPGASEAALKENAELKVDRVTLHRELQHYRKALSVAENQLESGRRQLAEAQDKATPPNDDGERNNQVEQLRQALDDAELEVEELSNREAELKEALEREKERHERDKATLSDRIDELMDQIDNEEDAAKGSNEELETIKDELEAKFQKELDARDEENDELKAEIEVLQTRLRKDHDKDELEAKFQKELDVRDEENDELKAEIEVLQTQLRKDHDKYETLQQEVADRSKAELVALRDQFELQRAKDIELRQQAAEGSNAGLKALRERLENDQRNQAEQFRQRREALEAEQQLLREQLAEERRSHAERCKQTSDMSKAELDARREAFENELNNHIEMHQQATERSRTELAALRKELEAKKKEARNLEEKVQGLEDEIVVLQGSMEDEMEQTKADLSAAQEELAALKEQLKGVGAERDMQSRKLRVFEENHARSEAYEVEIRTLKRQLADHRQQQEIHIRDRHAAEQSVAELRAKLVGLETIAHGAQSEAIRHAIEQERQERKEWQIQLDKAQVEIEDLEGRLSQQDFRVESLTLREKELRAQLKKARDERAYQNQKASKGATELDELQRRHEDAVSKISKREKSWEEERRALGQVQLVSHKQHQSELKGLAKQIMYLRKKCEREERFRGDLAFVKKFFMMQVEMYHNCNNVDLEMLAEMGITPDRSIREKKPGLRSFVLLAVAVVRMKKLKEQWAQTVKVKEKLVATFKQSRKNAQKKIGA